MPSVHALKNAAAQNRLLKEKSSFAGTMAGATTAASASKFLGAGGILACRGIIILLLLQVVAAAKPRHVRDAWPAISDGLALA